MRKNQIKRNINYNPYRVTKSNTKSVKQTYGNKLTYTVPELSKKEKFLQRVRLAQAKQRIKNLTPEQRKKYRKSLISILKKKGLY